MTQYVNLPGPAKAGVRLAPVLSRPAQAKDRISLIIDLRSGGSRSSVGYSNCQFAVRTDEFLFLV